VKKVPEGDGCDVSTIWGRGGSRRYQLLMKGKAEALRTSENIPDDLVTKADEE